MQLPRFTADSSLYQTSNRSNAVASAHTTASGVVPQRKFTTGFCSPCRCHTVGGCGVGPFSPGSQNCLEVDTHDSLNIFTWDLSVASVPCTGATAGPW
jgi:hypothetical protein